MLNVQQKQKLAEGNYLIKVKSADLAKSLVPGQYVSIQRQGDHEKYALYATDVNAGVVSFMISEYGRTAPLLKLKKGEKLQSCCGPLGKPFAINEYGNVIIIADKERIGPAFFFGKALKKAGNRVYFIGRYKNKKARFWESKMSKSFDKTFLLNEKEEINDSLLKELNNLLRRKHIKLTLALCEVSLFEKIAHLTSLRSSLYVSTLPLVKDGPSMCTCGRITLGNDTRFPSVDGPLFNGHRINWKHFEQRHLQEKEQLVDIDAD